MKPISVSLAALLAISSFVVDLLTVSADSSPHVDGGFVGGTVRRP